MILVHRSSLAVGLAACLLSPAAAQTVVEQRSPASDPGIASQWSADFGQQYGREAYGKDLRGPYYSERDENLFFERGGELRRQLQNGPQRFEPAGQQQFGHQQFGQDRFGQDRSPHRDQWFRAANPYQHPTESVRREQWLAQGRMPPGAYGPGPSAAFDPAYGAGPPDQRRVPPDFEGRVIAEADLNGDGAIDTQEYVLYRMALVERRAERGEYAPYGQALDRDYPAESADLSFRQGLYRWSGADQMQGQYGERPGYGRERPREIVEPGIPPSADYNNDGRIDTQEHIAYQRQAFAAANRGDYAAYYNDPFQAYPSLQSSLRDDRMQDMAQGRASPERAIIGADLDGDGDVDAEDYLQYRQDLMARQYRQYEREVMRQANRIEPPAFYEHAVRPSGAQAEAHSYGQIERDRFGHAYPERGVEPYSQFGRSEAPDRRSTGEIRDRLEAEGYADVSMLETIGDSYTAAARKDGQTVWVKIDARTGRITDEWQG